MAQSVSAEIGFTKNLGNFQSVKVSVGLEDYVRNGETFDQAYARIFKKIEDKLAEKVAEAVQELGG
ncbi:hypothetical protein SEA_LILMARTIN_71 [Streptomyces phage LilMartin]|nr:hypothetical protein SEA_LILMARTIN_71 [Streptomyces phage LilMartin]QNO12495.1 hypothetical protein SEA_MULCHMANSION_71 [Streptomyces phage MulchMansion]UVK61167.1 hypothetical protein SEA_ANGELA_71 [Streptomyces phage Angela]